MLGPSTRAVHAGAPPAAQGAPLHPGPALASVFHHAGDEAGEFTYGRFDNPTWVLLERAIGELEGGDALVFASGMAALSAAVLSLNLRAADVVVLPSDGYPGIRDVARDRLEPLGVEVRWAKSATADVLAALPGARLVWVETPSNPRLDVVDVRAVAEAAHEAGALLAVDNTLATPLGQRCLELGADLVMTSGTKSLFGHSDLLLGTLAARDPALLEPARAWRTQAGAIPGAFEAWLAHRSLATLDLRLTRQSDNALALAQALRGRDDVAGVVHPSFDPVAVAQMDRFGCLVGLDLGSAARASRFLRGCRLVAETTSFGGVQTTAERRARWGTDAVGEGFIRFSCGIEDTADLIADVAQALD